MPKRYKNKNKNFKPTKTINNQQKITIKISTPNLQFIKIKTFNNVNTSKH